MTSKRASMILASFLSLGVFLVALPAAAQSRTEQLRGDFGFAGSTVCVVSSAIITPSSYTPPAGFTNLVPNPGPTSVLSLSTNGVRRFNGDGTGSVSARVVSLVNPGAGSASDFTAQFTYSVAADGTVTLDQSPSTNIFVAGPRTGQQLSISGVPTLVGHLSSNGKSVTLASFDPGVETVTRILPNPGLVESLRICHRADSGFRIGSGND